MKKGKTVKGSDNHKYYIDSAFVNLKEKDYLENYIYSDELSDKINNYFKSDSNKPLYIGVIGSWGSGKTSIVETSLDRLDKETIIYRYDAWKYEGDSFRRSFIQTILNQSVEKYKLNKNNEVYKNISESLYEDYSISSNSIVERFKLSLKKDKKLSITSILLIVLISSILIAIGIYCICHNQISLGCIMTFLATLITMLGGIGLFDIFYSTIVYSKSKMFSSEQFYNSFTDILNVVKGDKNIILIDNLDRCSAIGLKDALNTIKGFYVENDESKLKDEKIAFIIPLDIDSLEEAYKNNKVFYLDKIFDDLLYIKQKYNTDKQDFINRILDEYPEINKLVSSNSKSIIINSVINTPREIIKILNDYVTEYNILMNKNGTEFVQNDKNRSYLMKTIIIKRLYYDFYKLAYNDLEQYIRIDMNPTLEDEYFKGDKDNELNRFLIINKAINPTNYYDFYQNQNVKSYNQIPNDIKNSIMEHDIKNILKYDDKNRIIDYYNNIYNDIANGFWNPNILNKYITLIELYNNKYFKEEELNTIINSWNKVFSNKKFHELNYENVDVIGFENELIFGTDIYKKKSFNLNILNWLKDNTYQIKTESERYEKISKWITKNNTIILGEDYIELIDSYCEHLLNNGLYSDKSYLEVLFGKNIKIVKVDKIGQFINRNIDNEIIVNLISNIKNEQINDSQIIEELKKWLNVNQITDIKVIVLALNYLIDNNVNLTDININNISIDEPIDDEKIKDIMSKYIHRNIYNDSLFNILKSINSKDTIKKILSNLTNNIPDNNSNYINHFNDYFFSLTYEIKKDNLDIIEKVINKYNNYEETILQKIINDNLLEDYYKNLKTPEGREHIIEKSMDLLQNDFDKQIENVFVYESSSNRMKNLMSNHTSINDYVLIINKMKKKSMKTKVVKELIDFLSEKDNITDEEIEIINTLDINKTDKERITEILISKETINKNLINLN